MSTFETRETTSCTLTSLPYFADSTYYFSRIRHLPWPVLLDSCAAQRNYADPNDSRFDIISANPIKKLITRGAITSISAGTQEQQSKADPFECLENEIACLPPSENTKNLPFISGALGFLSYDLGRRIEHIPSHAKIAIDVADMMMGIYHWAIVVDHFQKNAVLVSQQSPSDRDTLLALLKKKGDEPTPSFKLQSPFKNNLSKQAYTDAFDRIQQYIHEGDCYEVNLTQSFTASYDGDPWDAYLKLREKNPAYFAVYMHFDETHILSLSPERFLHLQNKTVTSKPIKGTRPRGKDATEDEHLLTELKYSEKDRAENVMIVDLVRNDLGRVCEPGSIKVPKLFEIETLPAVHHLVSTVTGILAEDKNGTDLLRATFPGGSITGAPKVRAIEIIDELEPTRRGVYCGSIGYISGHGRMDLNIAIRTLLANRGQIHCAGGGALVVDSKCEDEFEESLNKINNLMAIIEGV